MSAAPARDAVTGLILAGGRGQRLGGVDKGLQPWRGRPLVDHALARLAPQVSEVMISANRNASASGENVSARRWFSRRRRFMARLPL